MIIDKLIERIDEIDNPSVIGLDTAFEYLPDSMTRGAKSLEDAAKAITEFNYNIIESIYKIVPSVKIQVAYYEQYGVAGMATFAQTIAMAKNRGLITIADVKRNDIGSTAACYSNAYLGRTSVNGREFSAFESDFATINGYLGTDGIAPFLKDCEAHDKGIFVLCKTSNPSSGELQDLMINGESVCGVVGGLIAKWGEGLIGKHGYSAIGAVVGATHPRESEALRKKLPHTFFLVPGYGAQGGTAKDLRGCFDSKGRGAIVNSSRGILCAYKSEKYKGLDYVGAAYAAACDMQKDLKGAR